MKCFWWNNTLGTTLVSKGLKFWCCFRILLDQKWGGNITTYYLIIYFLFCYFTGPPDPVAGCQVTNKTFTTLSLDCKEGYDGGLKQHFVGILCPYNTFTEVLGDSQASNVVSIDKLKCDHEISRKRNFNGASFEFDGLPHSTPFSLAIFAQNTKVSITNLFKNYI